MKKNIYVKAAPVFLFVFSLPVLSSCQHIASITSVGAQIAGAAGIIDQRTADAVSQSSEAIGQAAEEINPEQEYYIGRAVGATILQNYRVWNGNPALTAYINRICNALVINSPRPDIYNGYHAAILDSAEINAFATSGGHIFITRALVDCAGSEDALAAVIAHEIAHTQLRHSIKAIKTSRITNALFVTGTSAVSALTDSGIAELVDVFDESVGEIVGTLVNSGYSQSQEFDADNTALALLASAGYEPSALIDMLRQLEKSQGSHSGGFNKTHPAPARRISNAEKAVGRYNVQDTRSYRRGRYAAIPRT
jgi:predicted Zn-dependent protease